MPHTTGNISTTVRVTISFEERQIDLPDSLIIKLPHEDERGPGPTTGADNSVKSRPVPEASGADRERHLDSRTGLPCSLAYQNVDPGTEDNSDARERNRLEPQPALESSLAAVTRSPRPQAEHRRGITKDRRARHGIDAGTRRPAVPCRG